MSPSKTMDTFYKKKRNVLTLINDEQDLYIYKDIYNNCENDIYSLYLNIINQYKNCLDGEKKLFLNKCIKNGNVKYIEKVVKQIIEKKNVYNDIDDKSIKKSIDLLIYPCVYEINKNEFYYTTSCCSGRIVIFKEVHINNKNDNQKKIFKNSTTSQEKKEENISHHLSNINLLNVHEKDELFLSHFKKNFILQNNEEKYTYCSDHDISSFFDVSKKKTNKWEDIYEEKNLKENILYINKEHKKKKVRKKKKIHKKNVHILYSSHSHQHLKYDIKVIKDILKKELFQNYFDVNQRNDYKNISFDFMGTKKYSLQNEVNLNSSIITMSDKEGMKKKEKNNKVINILNNQNKRNIFIKFEPFIIHVKCTTFLSALKLLKIAQYAGLKQSGILNFNKHVTVAIRGSMRLEHLLGDIHPTLQQTNLMEIIHICNNKLSKNLSQLVHFYKCFKQFKEHEHTYQFVSINREMLSSLENNLSSNTKQKKKSNKKNTLHVKDNLQDNKKIAHHMKKKKEINHLYLTCSGKKNIPNGNRSIAEQDKTECKLKDEIIYENTENHINIIKKEKNIIDLNKYNIQLNEEGYIINENKNDKFIGWKILGNNNMNVQNFFVWGHDMFMQENKIYMFGGFSKGVRNNKLKIYDIINKKHFIYDTELPSLVFHNFVQLDDKFAFIFGGRQNPKNCTNMVWVYNIKENFWIKARRTSTLVRKK